MSTVTLKVEIHLEDETLCLLIDTPLNKEEWNIKENRDNVITKIISNLVTVEVHDKEKFH
jgi:hypothetical protein